VLVLVVHRHDRHLHPCLLGVQENRERWRTYVLVERGSNGAVADEHGRSVSWLHPRCTAVLG
jgi:hypothetical protein